MILRVTATVLLLLFVSTPAFSEVPFPEACGRYYPQRAAALKAKDWKGLETAAVKFIEGCDKAYGDEELAKAYAELSIVFRNRKDPKHASQFAERAVFYSREPDFHIERAICLAQLGQTKEAGLELDVAELMAKLALKKNELKWFHHIRKDPDQYDKTKQHYQRIVEAVKDTRKASKHR